MALHVRIGLPSRSHHGMGEGRTPLQLSMQKEIVRLLPGLARLDLSGYQLERRRSLFPQTRWDMTLYDELGQAQADGREFYDGVIVFWMRIPDYRYKAPFYREMHELGMFN